MLTEMLHRLRVATCLHSVCSSDLKPQARLETTAGVPSGKHVVCGPFASGRIDEPCKLWEA